MNHFEPTRTPNLIRNKLTGVYFARAHVCGELLRRSLKTKNFAIAETKLSALLKDERKRINTGRSVGPEQSALGHVIDAYVKKMKADNSITESTKEYYEYCTKAIRRLWKPQLDQPTAKITEAMTRTLAAAVRKEFSPTRYNGTTDVLRAIFKTAIDLGIRTDNPATELTKAPIKPKQLTLPTAEQFAAMLAYLDRQPACREAARVVRWLAYTGMRIGEAGEITPPMVNLDPLRMEIYVPGSVGGERITKNGQGRPVPIIGEMEKLLVSMMAEYKDAGRKGPMLPAANVRYSLASACVAAKAPRITHHGLRHLFITRCLESGVDVKTIAVWVGHQDGGALILKTYAHLRNEHSQRMAALVKFGV